MIEQIEYYYSKKDIICISDNNYVDKDGNMYILKIVSNDFDINKIFSYIKYMRNPLYFIPILNINNSFFSKIDNKSCILFQVNGVLGSEVSLKEMINNNHKYRINNIKNESIGVLWAKKLDYLEYQVSELGKNKEEVINTFSFFLGLGENAITFLNVNNINFNNISYSISHYRINYPNLSNDYYDPLNLIEDYTIRDYAEYLKSKLLINNSLENDIKLILNNPNLTNDDIKLFYARLMFPTNYFDTVEKILLNETSEDNLDIYFERLPRYLNFLKDTYYEIIKKVQIIVPDWIKSQTE